MYDIPRVIFVLPISETKNTEPGSPSMTETVQGPSVSEFRARQSCNDIRIVNQGDLRRKWGRIPFQTRRNIP